MTSSARAPRNGSAAGFWLPLGTLIVLVTTAGGGAAFVTELDSTLGAAVQDLGEIKNEVRQMNSRLGVQAQGITSLQERDESRTRRLERLEGDVGELRERMRAVELKVRDR